MTAFFYPNTQYSQSNFMGVSPSRKGKGSLALPGFLTPLRLREVILLSPAHAVFQYSVVVPSEGNFAAWGRNDTPQFTPRHEGVNEEYK